MATNLGYQWMYNRDGDCRHMLCDSYYFKRQEGWSIYPDCRDLKPVKPVEPPKVYDCKMCGKQFNSFGDLDKHKRRWHNI